MSKVEKPLKGQHVLITRGGDQGEKFCLDVATAGGIPHMIPLIDFRSHEDVNAPYFLKHINQYDWIIFTSKNGVDYFFQHIQQLVDEEHFRPRNFRFGVVGEKTREALKKYKIPSQFMPNVYTAEDFSREFFKQGFIAKRVLIPKGNLASQTIAESFRNQGIIADEWIVYDTFYPTKDLKKLVQILKEDLLNVVAFTSPSTFHHFLKMVHEYRLQEHLKRILFAAIGTVTKKAIEEAGYTVAICPSRFTIDQLFLKTCCYFKEENKGEDRHGSTTI